jgi:hypothetical protein
MDGSLPATWSSLSFVEGKLMAGTGWNFLIEHDGNADALMPAIQTQVFQSGRFEIPIIEPGSSTS